MSLVLFCPWCQEKQTTSGTGPVWCKKCLHRVDVSREKCDCLNCSPFPSSLPDVPPREEAERVSTQDPFVFLNPNDPIDHLNVPDATTGPVQVVGRYFHAPHVTVTVYPSRVILAVGDGKQPDQWVHLIVDAEQLGAWVRAMGMCEDDDGEGIE